MSHPPKLASELKVGECFHHPSCGYCVCIPLDQVPARHRPPTTRPQLGSITVAPERLSIDAPRTVPPLPEATIPGTLDEPPVKRPIPRFSADFAPSRPRRSTPIDA